MLSKAVVMRALGFQQEWRKSQFLSSSLADCRKAFGFGCWVLIECLIDVRSKSYHATINLSNNNAVGWSDSPLWATVGRYASAESLFAILNVTFHANQTASVAFGQRRSMHRAQWRPTQVSFIIKHMMTREPTSQDIEELVAFLPRLYAEDFTPINGWGGGTQGQDEGFTLPWPEYDEVVVEFYRLASSECWADYGYQPEEAGRMLEDNELIKTADLAQIKTMLTYCVRGERFSTGCWAAMIKGGQVRRLLQRLADLETKNTNP